MPDQPMLGLELEPTIAMRRGEQYVVQCMGCGALLAVPEGATVGEPNQLGACPTCGKSGYWKPQHVPVGPFTAQWAHQLVGAAMRVAEDPDRIEELRDAIRRARRMTRETDPWLANHVV